MTKSALCLILVYILPFLAAAQKVKYELFNTADGLVSNESHDLVQDDRGFIWLLNASRIYRYDGRNFRQYPSPPSDLSGSDELLNHMTIYRDSLLFILAEKHAFLLDPNAGNWLSFPFKATQEEDLKIRQLIPIGSDNIFIETYSTSNTTQSKFWQFQNEELCLLVEDGKGFKASNVIESSQNEGGEAYYLFRDGELRMLDQNHHFQKVIHIPESPSAPSLILDYKKSKDNIFFNTNTGLFILKAGSDTLIPHKINDKISWSNVRDFQPMDNGDIWISGDFRHLYQYVEKEDKLYIHKEAFSEIFPYRSPLLKIFKDRTNILWISTQLGLLKVTIQGNLFDTYLTDQAEYCIGYCSFRGMVEDKDGNIYASFYSGIAKIDPNTDQIISTRLGPTPFGLEIEENSLMVLNGDRIEIDTQKRINLGGGFNTEGVYIRDGSGQLWISINEKLKRLDKSKEEWSWETITDFQSPNVSSLHYGQTSKLIWRGAAGELGSYSIKDQTTTSIRTRNMEIPISQILAIHENEEGHLWLGTDIGLIKYDPLDKQILAHYSSEDGLPNDYIASMLTEGDSCLWLGTNNGLTRFNIQEETFINFFTEDGLTYNEFNRVSYLKARDGRMYFGGLRGLNAFYPDEVIENFRIKNESAQVVLASFERVDERIDSVVSTTFFAKKPSIGLHHWDRSFTFEYALTDFDNSSDVFYSFKMEGYEDNWSNPSPYNFTRFSSLPSGDYTFRVKARDSRGLWHPNELEVQVSVLPPWWATWWAYLSYVILVAGGILGIIYFLRRRWMLQNQLLLEQKEALRLKDLDTFKSRLYTNLTHEFRTPLTVILGMADELDNDTQQLKTKAENKHNLSSGFQLIRANGQRMLQLVNQLLDLSKLEDQSLSLQLVQADIVNYLAYLTTSFQPLANSRNILLKFFSEKEKLEMDFDPEQIAQVFTNLISNALKFTPSGGKVSIRLTSKDHQFILQIEDSGIGITEKDIEHIFNRFYQVDGSSTRVGEGTGIGLAHTQELVKLMKGDIVVESEEGKGSCFTVTLPISRTAPMDSLQVYYPKNSEVPSTIQTQLPKPAINELQKLLIIEDNPDVVTYLTSSLKGLYELDIAYNGKIGIEKAFSSVPDLIISDVMMPEKDGFEVCETIKNDERTSHIPIILLTAKADQASKITGLRKGADAYLPKPFHKEELLIRLEKLISLRSQLQKRYAAWTQTSTTHGINLDEDTQQNPEFVMEDAFLTKVRTIIDKELSNSDFNPDMLGQAMGLSTSQLYRKIKALTGSTPALFVRSIRLNKAKELLKTTDLNVSEIAYEVGFSSPSYFSRSFSEEFGSSPNENRG